MSSIPYPVLSISVVESAVAKWSAITQLRTARVPVLTKSERPPQAFQTRRLSPFFTIMLPAVQMTRIFVYGTLKKGQPNNYRMLDPAKGKAIFCTNARTVDKYPLVIAGQFNIPFLLNIPGQGHHIQGEIYSVDDQMLRYLDHFESVPDMYQRTLIQLQVEETPGSCGHAPAAGTTVEAYLYSTTTYKPEWVNLQTFENYDSYGDHGLEYVTREARDD